jgi:hypothetical protein
MFTKRDLRNSDRQLLKRVQRKLDCKNINTNISDLELKDETFFEQPKIKNTKLNLYKKRFNKREW